MPPEIIGVEEFKRGLASVCLRRGAPGLPGKRQHRDILFKSILLTLEPSRSYTERELNDALKSWKTDVARFVEMDHASLRRELVDAGWLRRTPDGASYRAGDPPEGTLFDPAVDALAPREVVEAAEREAEERKRRHLAGEGGA